MIGRRTEKYRDRGKKSINVEIERQRQRQPDWEIVTKSKIQWHKVRHRESQLHCHLMRDRESARAYIFKSAVWPHAWPSADSAKDLRPSTNSYKALIRRLSLGRMRESDQTTLTYIDPDQSLLHGPDPTMQFTAIFNGTPKFPRGLSDRCIVTSYMARNTARQCASKWTKLWHIMCHIELQRFSHV